jgi:hypothetical protein
MNITITKIVIMKYMRPTAMILLVAMKKSAVASTTAIATSRCYL